MRHTPYFERSLQELPGGRPWITQVPSMVCSRLQLHWRAWDKCAQGGVEKVSPGAVAGERRMDMQWDMGLTEPMAAFMCAVLFTALRVYLNDRVFKRWVAEWRAPKQYAHRLQEDMWKLGYYTAASMFNVYLVLYKRPYLMTDPMHLWYEWHETLQIPRDIQLQYLIQAGFYLHSVYATTFMDSRRKDYFVMNVHHIVTLTLISISYATRHHLFGIMVLFCHDFNDIFLETWNWQSHLRRRNNSKHYRYHDIMSILAFMALVTSWYYTRLYLYPSTVLYAAFDVPMLAMTLNSCRWLAVIYTMLIMLLFMNMYWWWLMVSGIFRLLLGNLSEVADEREYAVVDSEPTCDGTHNGTDHAHSGCGDARPCADCTENKCECDLVDGVVKGSRLHD